MFPSSLFDESPNSVVLPLAVSLASARTAPEAASPGPEASAKTPSDRKNRAQGAEQGRIEPRSRSGEDRFVHGLDIRSESGRSMTTNSRNQP